MTPPRSVARLADVLRAAKLRQITIPGCSPAVEGTPGIRKTSGIQYNQESWQLLGRAHEYSFSLHGATPLEVSLQLYLNVADHYRLFAYCKRGMLLSANLTLGEDDDGSIVLQQQLKLTTQSMTAQERVEGATALAEHLASLGFQVAPKRRVELGTFDGQAGRFLDTTPEAFLRDFLVAAVIKGHFMANKAYQLPGLEPAAVYVARSAPRNERDTRAVSARLRYQVLERDRGRCVLCGARPADGVRLHVDHILPWSRGGRTTLENLQTLCALCNLGKGNRSQTDHRPADGAM